MEPRFILLFTCWSIAIILIYGIFQITRSSLDYKLLKAFDKKDIFKMQKLLNHGADVNFYKGYLLRTAFFDKDLAMIDFLINNGANTEYINSYNNLDVIPYSLTSIDDKTCKFIINRFPEKMYLDNFQAFYIAIAYERYDVFHYMIEKDKGEKLKCYDCIIKSTCRELCKDFIK